MTEALVLDDGSMADTLILVEDPVGKYLPVPPYLQVSIAEVVEIGILATQPFGDNTAIQDELLAIVGQGQLLGHMPLLSVAQDIAEPFRTYAHPAMGDRPASRLRQRTSR